MKLIEFNHSPTDGQLRQFGAVCIVMLPTLGWIWGGSMQIILGLCILGGTLALSGFLWPASLKPIFLTLMAITCPIGLLVGELSMIDQQSLRSKSRKQSTLNQPVFFARLFGLRTTAMLPVCLIVIPQRHRMILAW